MSIVQFSYGCTAVSFALLSILMLVGWRRYPVHPMLFGASVFTSIWGAVIFTQAASPMLGSLFTGVETIKAGVWILLLASLLIQFWRQSNSLNYTFWLSLTIAFVFTLQLFIDFGAQSILDVNMAAAPLQNLIVQAYIFGRLLIAIAGLVLMENLYRSAEHTEKWKLRPLGLAIGAMFAFDIILYAEGLLFTRIDSDLFDARGLINAMVAPLILVSVRRKINWTFDVVLNRRAVFHSLSLLVVGCYLIFMAFAGWGLRQFGGTWGAVLQISFLGAAALFLIYLFVSEGARAWARVNLAKYFRRYKYDYRDVWLKFISGIDAHSDSSRLGQRVVEGVCKILDSQGGCLYLENEDGEYTLAETWHFSSDVLTSERADSSLARFLSEKRWIIDLNEVRAGDGRYADLKPPKWAMEEERAWLIIPLLRDRLIGYVVIRQPRAARRLDWEDHDLLKTIGVQSASYLAEQRSQAALAETQQFDTFNRRFAFIMHDLKNLVSQLSLLSRNMERHGADPEFQKDMAETLQSSVAKITTLLAKLSQRSEGPDHIEVVDAREIIRSVVDSKAAVYKSLEADVPSAPLYIEADKAKLEQVIVHLVQNAMDASRDDQPIKASATLDTDKVRIHLVDHGCGMSHDFIQSQLFKPFVSTKEGGFGIGAYESRELVRQMGGQVSVTSAKGKGTTFVLTFPQYIPDAA